METQQEAGGQRGNEVAGDEPSSPGVHQAAGLPGNSSLGSILSPLGEVHLA